MSDCKAKSEGISVLKVEGDPGLSNQGDGSVGKGGTFGVKAKTKTGGFDVIKSYGAKSESAEPGGGGNVSQNLVGCASRVLSVPRAPCYDFIVYHHCSCSHATCLIPQILRVVKGSLPSDHAEVSTRTKTGPEKHGDPKHDDAVEVSVVFFNLAHCKDSCANYLVFA